MKKYFLTLGAATLAASLFMTGCSSTDAQARFDQQKKELDEFLVGAKAVETIEKTNDKTIDALADNSTIIYKRTGGLLLNYIQESRGSQAVIEMTYFMHTTPNATQEELKAKAEGFIQSSCTESEKKEMTAEKLIAAGKVQYQYDMYLSFREDFKEPEARKAHLAELEKNAASDANAKRELTDIQEGEKILKERVAKTDINAKIAELKKLLEDAQKIGENLGVVGQDIAQKIQAKATDISGLAQDPAMQNFVKETAPLVAKKTFADEARVKELDAEIDKIAAKAEYKPIMDKKAQYEQELTKLKHDAGILADGVGGQINFTVKAIPWVISQYLEMQSYASAE